MSPNRPPLDEDSAGRMLGGHVHPDDAPPGYGPVAGLLAAASALPEVDEDAAGVTISAMVEAVRDRAYAPQTPRRKSILTKLLAGKAALATIGVIALTASGAAAATGSLPDPAQGAVAGAVSHVGVHIPQPGNEGKSAAHRQDADHRQDGAHRPTDDSSTSTTAGADDSAGQDNHGATVSGTAHQAKEDGQPVGPTVCAVASAGKCKAGSDHSGKGDDDETTTSSTAGAASDHSQAGEHTQGDDHSQAGEDHGARSTTVTTGSLATGEDHSGKDLPADDGQSSSGRH